MIRCSADSCASETGWPLRYAKDAVHDAQERITGRRPAMQDALTLWQHRMKKTRTRLASGPPDSRRIPGLETQTPATARTPVVLSATRDRWDGSACDLRHAKAFLRTVPHARSLSINYFA
jgi:hypothetical protein